MSALADLDFRIAYGSLRTINSKEALRYDQPKRPVT
jgi:hypothetical protein